MADTVEAMEMGEKRSKLELAVAAAAQTLSDFFTNILSKAQAQQLTNHNVASTYSSFYIRAADKSTSRVSQVSCCHIYCVGQQM